MEKFIVINLPAEDELIGIENHLLTQLRSAGSLNNVF